MTDLVALKGLYGQLSDCNNLIEATIHILSKTTFPSFATYIVHNLYKNYDNHNILFFCITFLNSILNDSARVNCSLVGLSAQNTVIDADKNTFCTFPCHIFKGPNIQKHFIVWFNLALKL